MRHGKGWRRQGEGKGGGNDGVTRHKESYVCTKGGVEEEKVHRERVECRAWRQKMECTRGRVKGEVAGRETGQARDVNRLRQRSVQLGREREREGRGFH